MAAMYQNCNSCSLSSLYGCALSQCLNCNQSYCRDCIVEIKETPPREISTNTSLTAYLVCKGKCNPKVVNLRMTALTEKVKYETQELIKQYFESEESRIIASNQPGKVNDNVKRIIFRFARIVCRIRHIIPYGSQIELIIKAYGVQVLINQMLASEIHQVFDTLFLYVKDLGIGSNLGGIFHVYYLACSHMKEKKENIEGLQLIHGFEMPQEFIGDVPGLLSVDCPTALLDICGEYIKCAEWLYISRLHRPHNDNERRTQYLAQLVSRQGYTVLFCLNETSLLPNGYKCPAFALLIRNQDQDEAMYDDSTVPEYARKLVKRSNPRQAILAIRGSAEVMDWAINLNEARERFKYTSRNGIAVDGHVHCGMRAGAMGILDVYCMRHHLEELCERGYDISVVGHSLGAGTSAIIATELRNGFILSKQERLQSAAVNGGIKAVCYATPPVFSENISDAIFKDQFILNYIHHDDVVPRFSSANIKTLANEVKDFIPTANEWLSQDIKNSVAFAVTLGKAKEMKQLGDDCKEGSSGQSCSATTVVCSDSNPLVVPGLIIQSYINASGEFATAMINHNHSSLKQIKLFLDTMVEHHKLSAHWQSLRAHRLNNYLKDPCPTRKIFTRESAHIYRPVSIDTAKCAVCTNDCNWCHVFRSNGNKARYFEQCSVCRNAICPVCSPAGDVIVGDGIDNSLTLDDLRIIAPISLHVVTTQRICKQCYLDSYDII